MSPPSRLAAMDVAGRAGRLRGRLAEAGCEALLVSNRSNVRYLCGFSGSAGLLLVLAEELVVLTDGRYATQLEAELEAAGVRARTVVGDPVRQLEALKAALAGVDRLGLEAEAVSWARQRRLAEELAPVETVPTTGLVEALRRVKDPGELDRIARAAEIADQALQECLPLVGAGASEAEVALALDSAMRRLGAQRSSFETIVASGPNSAMPHARPTSRRIAEGDLVVVDFGAVVDGYCSDTTRTFVRSGVSAARRRMLEVVRHSQAAGVAALRAGRPASEVDGACRQVIEQAGWADAFVHGTGHGVGLDIHEAPAVASRSADMLEAGCVVTVEPGVYLPGEGGVRIEDTLVVTSDGSRALTRFPKELVVV
ncbi:MAG TPA: aminopeptidase P family protein [Acidimicrobiales bacterium]|nr:aminopeptidase P family protein [Acidimicrobiales bacterium]